MRSRQLQQLLVTLTGRVPGDIDTRTRALRMMNEIGSGRGYSAPHMNSGEWALHVLSLVSRRVPDAGEVVTRLHKLCRHRLTPETRKLLNIPHAHISLATFLALAIEDGMRWAANIEIDEEGRYAFVNVVRSDDELPTYLYFSINEDEDCEFVDSMSLGTRFVIGGAMLHFLHQRFVEDASALASPETAEVA